MLDILDKTEMLVLPHLLRIRDDRWNSLLINYHPPVVERVWTQLGKYRINLHRIHPCTRGESLFHPHSWPSWIKLLSGSYTMDIGHGEGDQEPSDSDIDAVLFLAEGSKYAMPSPNGWHRIYSADISTSLMITGPPWRKSTSGKSRDLSPLTHAQVTEILGSARAYYPHTVFNLREQRGLFKFIVDMLEIDNEGELEKILN